MILFISDTTRITIGILNAYSILTFSFLMGLAYVTPQYISGDLARGNASKAKTKS